MLVFHAKKQAEALLLLHRAGSDTDLLQHLAVEAKSPKVRLTDDTLNMFGDMLVVVGLNRILAIFDIDDFTRQPDKRIVFDLHPANDLAGMVGGQIPGGPWKRGESRPVRHVPTNETVAPSSPGDTIAGALVATLDAVIDERAIRTPLDPVGDLLDRVQLERNPRGGIIVRTPPGVPVLVLPNLEGPS